MCCRGIAVAVGVLLSSACELPLAPAAAENPFAGGTTAVKHEQSVPISGVVIGEASFDFENNPRGCPSGFTTITRAEGTISHLGRATWHSEHCVSMDTGAIAGGHLVLRAANGDEIHAQYSGYSGAIPAQIGGVIDTGGTMTFSKGTGRFAEATGTAEFTGAVTFEGFEDPAWAIRLELTGRISY